MDYSREAKDYYDDIHAFLGKVRRGRRVAKHDPQAPQFSQGAEDLRVLKSLGIKSTMPYETSLTDNEEKRFQVWKQTNTPNDSGQDYDLRGAFKAGIMPAGPEAGNDAGHFPDTYKKPSHPTFSDQSIYSSLTGTRPGHWDGDVFTPFQTTPPEKLKMNDPSPTDMHKSMLQSGPFKVASDRQNSWRAAQGIQVAGLDTTLMHPNVQNNARSGNAGQDQQMREVMGQDAPPIRSPTPSAPGPRLLNDVPLFTEEEKKARLGPRRVAPNPSYDPYEGMDPDLRKAMQAEDNRLKNTQRN